MLSPSTGHETAFALTLGGPSTRAGETCFAAAAAARAEADCGPPGAVAGACCANIVDAVTLLPEMIEVVDSCGLLMLPRRTTVLPAPPLFKETPLSRNDPRRVTPEEVVTGLPGTEPLLPLPPPAVGMLLMARPPMELTMPIRLSKPGGCRVNAAATAGLRGGCPIAAGVISMAVADPDAEYASDWDAVAVSVKLGGMLSGESCNRSILGRINGR